MSATSNCDSGSLTLSLHLAAISSSKTVTSSKKVPFVTKPKRACRQSRTLVSSQVKLIPNNVDALLHIPHGREDGKEICQTTLLPVNLGVWFAVYGVNLHQLCLANSINHPSEKSIESALWLTYHSNSSPIRSSLLFFFCFKTHTPQTTHSVRL